MNVELTIKGDVERLRLGPGEILLVKLRAINRTEFEQVVKLLTTKLAELGIPKERTLVVAADGIDFSVVKQEELPT